MSALLGEANRNVGSTYGLFSRLLLLLFCLFVAVSGRAGVFDSWNYRMQVSFDEPIAGSLTNFSALVVLGTNISGFSYGDCEVGGSDLRFADSNETVALNYEIEAWATNGSSYVWVQVPLLSSTNDYIYAYWCRNTNPAPCTTNGATWSNAYVGVWHLNDDEIDSSTSTNHGSRAGATSATGRIATARGFDGDSDYVDCGTAASLDVGPARTISAWIKPTTLKSYAAIVCKDSGLTSAYSYMMCCHNNGTLIAYDGGTWRASANMGISAGNWYHVVFETPGDGNIYFYVNGQAAGAATFPHNDDPNDNVYIGSWLGSSTSYDFKGVIDEARISSVARGSKWAWACWLNQVSNDVFVSYGTPGITATDLLVAARPVSGLGTNGATLNGIVFHAGGAENPDAYFCWGDEDGGTTGTSTWDHAKYVGADWGAGDAYSTNISGLFSGSNYLFRCYVTNSTGDDWSDSVRTFATVSLPAVTNTGATPVPPVVSRTAARLHGEVTATGNQSPYVWFHYWLQGAATTNILAAGSHAGACSAYATGLVAGTYEYQVLASNIAGSVWSHTDSFDAWGEVQVTWYVKTNGVEGANGTNWANALLTVSNAMARTRSGDMIIVSNGTYNTVAEIIVTNGVTVTGSTANAADVIIKRSGAGGNHRVFYLNHSNAVLDTITVRNGNDTGGGVYIAASGTVQNCVITDNHAPNNKAGAGIYLYRGGLVQNCQIVANTMGDYSGAGVYCYQGGLVRNCSITDNIVRRYGGGAYLNGGGTLRNCLISGNRSGTGATAGNGGGVYFNAAGGLVENCTVVDNEAWGKGGGTYFNSGGTLSNSIVYFNTAAGGANYTNNGGGWSFSYCCTTPGSAGTSNITSDPQLEDVATNNFRLLPGSPCIDSGLSNIWMLSSVDLDGTNRILDATVDMGAYEFSVGDLACNPVADPLSGFVSNVVVLTAYVTGSNTNGLYYKWDYDNDSVFDNVGYGKRVVTNTYWAGLYSMRLVVSNEFNVIATLTKSDHIKVGPAIAYVSLAGSHQQPYTNWSMAATNIQVAVDAGVDGTVVLVTNGTYGITNQITVTDGVTVRGVNGAENTVVKRVAASQHRVFRLSHSNAVLDGLMITNGYENGGGVYIATYGTVQNCILTGNRAPNNCNGAGVYLYGGGLVKDCIIRGNTMGDYNGGGVCQGGGIVQNCIIDRNKASYGGGVYRTAGILRNCAITGNRVIKSTGGGVRMTGGTLESCTIVSNVSASTAGGIYCTGGTITNTIIYFNTGTSGSNYVDTGGTWTYCCTVPAIAGTSNITDNPLIKDLAGGNYRLADGSPCANAGLELPWMTGAFDLDGSKRILGRAVDIGAYETIPPPPGTMFEFY